MTKEERHLILKDLCGRLPYSPLVYLSNPMDSFDSELCTTVIEHLINEEYEVKPYLLPLSNMTKGQRREFYEAIRPGIIEWLDETELLDCDKEEEDRPVTQKLVAPDVVETDWLNVHHFDYRGLIEKGLAIDATKLNIYKL